jgi:glycosyltransferase involved in cell wall biosynthesis
MREDISQDRRIGNVGQQPSEAVCHFSSGIAGHLPRTGGGATRTVLRFATLVAIAMLISVIVPAFNEERYLSKTLQYIRQAKDACDCPTELIVVDNASTDRTAEIARSAGANVILESIHNIGRVRNTGAHAARGDVLVFIDADTTIPPCFLARVAEEMRTPKCLGGAANTLHQPVSKLLRAYLAAWRWIGIKTGMAQGAAQFVRASAYTALGGYDESQFMGEDVDFFWRLKARCKTEGGKVTFLNDVPVLPSTRRFDQAPIWRTLVWTNPLFIAAFRRTAGVWRDWYVDLPR